MSGGVASGIRRRLALEDVNPQVGPATSGGQGLGGAPVAQLGKGGNGLRNWRLAQRANFKSAGAGYPRVLEDHVRLQLAG